MKELVNEWILCTCIFMNQTGNQKKENVSAALKRRYLHVEVDSHRPHASQKGILV